MVIDFYNIRYTFFAFFSFFLFSKNIARIIYLYFVYVNREKIVFRLVTKDFTDIFRDFLSRNILFLDTYINANTCTVNKIFSCKKKKKKERREKNKRKRNNCKTSYDKIEKTKKLFYISIFKRYELFFIKMINLGRNKKVVRIMEISYRICLNNIL